MATLKIISAALKLVDVKKENLKKAFEDLQSHSSSLSSFNLTWSDLDSYFTSLQSSLQHNFNLLQSQSQPQSQQLLQIEPQSQSPKSSVIVNSARPELKSFCENMDGLGLRKYMIERPKVRNSIRVELPDALRGAPDAAAMVLDAMEGFYVANSKGDKDFELCTVRRCCVVLLEELQGLKVEIIRAEVKVRAMKLAAEWKGKVSVGGENPLEALAFLHLLAAYGLADGFDVEELLEFAVLAAKFRQATELCRVLGFGDKISDVRQLPKNFRQSYIVRPGLKKLLDLPLQQRKAPLVLNFIPTYTSKLADVPRQRKKSASPSTASTEQVASTSEPVNQPSTSAPHSIPVQEKKRRRRLVKAAQMKQPQKKVLNLLAILPDDMDDEPALPTPQPKTKRMKKTQPKAKVTEVDDAEDAVPISKLTKNTTSAPAKRPAEVQPTGATQQKKQKSAAGTSSGSRGPKIPWEPKITLEDRPVYKNESAADPQIGVALSTAVLLDGDMEKNEKMGGYENYARMLQHSVQAIQHAHSFSMLAFETGKRLEDTEKELADLKRSQKKDQLRMKKLEDQAAEATKAKQIADEKAEATEALRTVAVAQQKEAEEKAAQAQKELQEGLATKEADLNAFYNKGMEDVAADYELQVKQACNHGFILGYNALAKKLNLPADSPWRKTESLRLPCPLPPSPSQAEVESESEAEAEDETLVRKARSPTQIDLTRDEEVEAAPKKTDFGTLTSDLLLIGRSVEETVAEIDAEVAADKVAEVATDKPAEVSQNKEAEVVVEGQTKVVAEESAEVVPEGPSEVSTQPTPEAEAA